MICVIDARPNVSECVWEMEMSLLFYLQCESFSHRVFCVYKEADKECELLRSKLACHHLIGHGRMSARACVC